MHAWSRRLIGEKKVVLTQWKGPESLTLTNPVVVLPSRGRVGIAEVDVMTRPSRRAISLETISESST